MTSADKDKIVERVRKLMALATSDNEHEAALAAAKAQELLMKYNLEMSEVEAGSEEEEIVKSELFDHDSYSMGWRSLLLNGIARSCLCRLVQRTDHNFAFGKKFTIVGERANVEVAAYLYEYLSKELIRLSPKPAASATSHAFRVGAASAIYHRLENELKQFEEASEQTQALIVVKDAAVEAKLKEFFPRLRNNPGARAGDSDAYYAGHAAGRNMPIHRGVTSNPGGQKLLG